MRFNTLWEGKYMKVISPDIAPYETVLEPDAIMVMPLIKSGGKIYTYIRLEYCPPYFVREEETKMFYTTITGKMEPGEDADAAMLRELEEESGLRVKNHKVLFSKKNIPICKSTTLRLNFYIIDVRDAVKVPIRNDGTAYEDKSKTLYVSLDELKNILDTNDNIDYLLVSAYYTIKSILGAKA